MFSSIQSSVAVYCHAVTMLEMLVGVATVALTLLLDDTRVDDWAPAYDSTLKV
jgi:hypothetical protein